MINFVRRAGALAVTAALAAVLMPLSVASAANYEPLNGDGSSWAGPAIDQWGRDVRSQGIVINFNPDGSASGRNNYLQNQSDFAATDVQYLTQGDPFGSGIESPYGVAYSYIPIVAGGTSFLYNLSVGGRKITNLRLSGDTITKIFTGQITNWNDSHITHDYGQALPSQPITVVTRSDGSGASYQFTRWMWRQYNSQWEKFCHARGGPANCGPTEFYPGFQGSQQRPGSDQVANYITANYGEGSIGYDEYAYALESGISVVKLLNPAGYYTLPSPSNVAIALQRAKIDENPKSLTFLIQNLDNVYTNPDPRSYPLSSYSYLIVPRSNRRTPNGQVVGPPPRFNTVRGKTLTTWLNYVLCGAQKTAGQLGYSPLPKNLVTGGFTQTNYIPGHIKTPNLTQLNNCDNPTYHNGVNYLIKDAPFPSKCDKVGTSLNCGPGATVQNSSGNGGGGNGRRNSGGSNNGGSNGGGNNGGGSGGGGGGSGTGNTGTTGGGGGTVSGGGSGSGTGSGGGGAVTHIDPQTGQTVGPQAASGQGSSVRTSQIYAQPVSVNGSSGNSGALGTLAAVEIVAAVLVPGLFGSWLYRRKRSQ